MKSSKSMLRIFLGAVFVSFFTTQIFAQSDTRIAPLYKIGFSAKQGGYIFSLSKDRKHGLVAETQDQAPFSTWYDAQNKISDPANHNNKYHGAYFRDWRMPTQFELNLLYLQKDKVGGFANKNYWSSSELDFYNGWYQDFSSGNQDYISKYSSVTVRAVRVF
ncbi:MAG TPA: Lcl C-terminal domain-containing protein [Candidatus Brocadiaceae bacterium]